MTDFSQLGTDLRLLGDLEHQHSRNPGNDLRTMVRPAPERTDLLVVDGVQNLQQALMLRFLTPRGDLAVLGHPTYGSRLHLLVGEPNTETNRNRAKLYVLEALQEEPRVASVRSLRVTTGRADRGLVDIEASLVVSGIGEVLNLVFPFFLGGDGA
jgi:phage baseplate assembly protein W